MCCVAQQPHASRAQGVAYTIAAAAQRAPGGKVVAVVDGNSLPATADMLSYAIGARLVSSDPRDAGDNAGDNVCSTREQYVPDNVQDKLDRAWRVAMQTKRYLAEVKPPPSFTWTAGLAGAGLGVVAARFPRASCVVGALVAVPVLFNTHTINRSVV